MTTSSPIDSLDMLDNGSSCFSGAASHNVPQISAVAIATVDRVHIANSVTRSRRKAFLIDLTDEYLSLGRELVMRKMSQRYLIGV